MDHGIRRLTVEWGKPLAATALALSIGGCGSSEPKGAAVSSPAAIRSEIATTAPAMHAAAARPMVEPTRVAPPEHPAGVFPNSRPRPATNSNRTNWLPQRLPLVTPSPGTFGATGSPNPPAPHSGVSSATIPNAPTRHVANQPGPTNAAAGMHVPYTSAQQPALNSSAQPTPHRFDTAPVAPAYSQPLPPGASMVENPFVASAGSRSYPNLAAPGSSTAPPVVPAASARDAWREYGRTAIGSGQGSAGEQFAPQGHSVLRRDAIPSTGTRPIQDRNHADAPPAITDVVATTPARIAADAPVGADRAGVMDGAVVGGGSIAAAQRQRSMNEMAAAFAPVCQRADAINREGFELAERGASFAARHQFQLALMTMARSLDAYHQETKYTTALAGGWRALEESRDFTPNGSLDEAAVSVARIAEAHRTPVLIGIEADSLTPLAAVQLYYGFARQQLALASGELPPASVALYGLGKLASQPSIAGMEASPEKSAEAMVFYQAALEVDARNHLASNELGVLLARAGAWAEARQSLMHSVSVAGQPSAWHNLSVVQSQMGDVAGAQFAEQQHQIAMQRGAAMSGSNNDPAGSVQWMTPEQFTIRSGGAPMQQAMPPMAAPPGPARGSDAGDRTAVRESGAAGETSSWWMWWK